MKKKLFFCLNLFIQSNMMCIKLECILKKKIKIVLYLTVIKYIELKCISTKIIICVYEKKCFSNTYYLRFFLLI